MSGQPRTRTRPARPGPDAITANSRSSRERGYPQPAAQPRRRRRVHLPAQANASATTASWCCARTSAAAKGEDVLIDEIRYFFYFTTYHADTHTPAQIVELANDRCDQENICGQLKSGLGALRAPVDDLHSNWAYMLIAALAWNIKSWHAMMMHRKHDRHAFIRMEFKRFLDTVIRIPAMVIVRARAIVVRLVAYTVNLDRFFSAWATTERTRFGYG